MVDIIFVSLALFSHPLVRRRFSKSDTSDLLLLTLHKRFLTLIPSVSINQ